jgi:endonuclease III
MTVAPASSVSAVIDVLAATYPPPEAFTDPLALILWENVGYLIPDDRRADLFAELAQRVGLTAQALLAASDEGLLDIARRGGMRPEERVRRLREIGRVTQTVGGDLLAALTKATPAKARGLLKQYPMIADPGADKILLFCGLSDRPALESNGVRVLVRLGLAAPGKSYAHAYRNTTAALAGLEPARLITAFQVLRSHGQALCKRGGPTCTPCPLEPACPKAEAAGL